MDLLGHAEIYRIRKMQFMMWLIFISLLPAAATAYVYNLVSPNLILMMFYTLTWTGKLVTYLLAFLSCQRIDTKQLAKLIRRIQSRLFWTWVIFELVDAWTGGPWIAFAFKVTFFIMLLATDEYSSIAEDAKGIFVKDEPGVWQPAAQDCSK